MNFIKEIHQCENRYFFEDLPGHKCSPYFHTIDGADHWRTFHLQDSYKGTEHRLNQPNRRKNANARAETAMPVWPHTSVLGRRETDQPLKVDTDLTANNIEQLLEWTRGRGI